MVAVFHQKGNQRILAANRIRNTSNTMVLGSLLASGLLLATAAPAAQTELIFMAGNSQQLGYNNAWKLDLSLKQPAAMIANSSEGGGIDPAMMFTSNAAICGGVHYSLFWYLLDGSDAKHRRYGVGQIDLATEAFTWSFLPAKKAFFGVWCAPLAVGTPVAVAGKSQGDYLPGKISAAAADGTYSIMYEDNDEESAVPLASIRPVDSDSLLVVSAPVPFDLADDDVDPLRAAAFTVERATLGTANWTTTAVAGPIAAPSDEYVPTNEGLFSFDGVSRLWATFSLEHQPGLAHRNAAVIHVLDTRSNTSSTHHTKAESGYAQNTQAVPPGSGSTWAVMRRLKNGDRKEVLKLATLDLDIDAGTDIAPTADIADVSGIAASSGMPAAVCNGNVVTYNTDNFHWFNITSFDPRSGSVLWNLDTLSALPGTSYAFASAFACY